MLDHGASMTVRRIRRAVIALVLVVGTALALLLAHASETSHADGPMTVTAESSGYESAGVVEYAPVAQVDEALGLGGLDAGMLCLTLALGCVAALLAIALRAPARGLGLWLRAVTIGSGLPRPPALNSLFLPSFSILRI